MLRKCIKTVLRYILYAIIALVIGLYAHVLLCDVWRLPVPRLRDCACLLLGRQGQVWQTGLPWGICR